MRGLRVEHVSHAYGETEILKNVSLSVEPGQLNCLVGPSGCGKTTVLRLAAGLEPVQQGRITIDGTRVSEDGTASHVPPERRGVGLMFQDYALFPHLSVAKNITFGLDNGTAQDQSWLGEAIERMGLTPHLDSYPHTLSGGQQQRVALMRALAPSPRVILLDEPFSGLDASLRVQIREETRTLLRDLNMATLMVTHDPEEAMSMADRILVMREGRIVQSGDPFETYMHPVDAYVAKMFGPVNRLRGVVADAQVETPLATFEAAGLPDGTPVDILIRPEGLSVIPAGPCQPGEADGEVISARLLGRSSRLRVAVRYADGAKIPLEAWIPGVMLPTPGAAVNIEIDAWQAMVFASGAD